MEDVGSKGTPHKKAAVLMISWAKDLDELDTGPEVKELADTFRKSFFYAVVEVELTAATLPNHQLMQHLAKFIEEYDNKSTLLIIYYAGMISDAVSPEHRLTFNQAMDFQEQAVSIRSPCLESSFLQGNQSPRSVT